MAGGLLAWLVNDGVPTIEKDEFIKCLVGEHYYVCSGHPQRFYLYVLCAAILILTIYIFCCTFNILWLFCPGLGSLSGVMRKYRKEFKKMGHNTKDQTDQEIFGDLYDLYYNNRDLKLLLDLLATSSGIAPCLRLLCLFDVKMRTMAEVQRLTVTRHKKENSDRWDAVVNFDDPAIMKDIFSKIDVTSCSFTIEIIPCLNEVRSVRGPSSKCLFL